MSGIIVFLFLKIIINLEFSNLIFVKGDVIMAQMWIEILEQPEILKEVLKITVKI